ncbi:MAG: hypothetical protein ACT4OX_09205 [Actinomycetota bacterium]
MTVVAPPALGASFTAVIAMTRDDASLDAEVTVNVTVRGPVPGFSAPFVYVTVRSAV